MKAIASLLILAVYAIGIFAGYNFGPDFVKFMTGVEISPVVGAVIGFFTAMLMIVNENLKVAVEEIRHEELVAATTAKIEPTVEVVEPVVNSIFAGVSKDERI